MSRSRKNEIYGRTVSWSTRSDISPLRYPGGKRKLAPFIADLMERSSLIPDLFVEPFAGGAAVAISLLECGRVRSIGLADADPLVAGFWQVVLSDQATVFADMVRSADVTLEEWKRIKFSKPALGLETAYKCLFLNRTSFSGALMAHTGPIGGMSQQGAYKIDCRFNRSQLAARIIELSRLRDRIAFVRCESYADTIQYVRDEHGDASMLWYLDPPFFAKAERLYRHSFKTSDHEALAAAVGSIPGNWILSYDDHPDARRMYAEHHGFARINLQYSARIDDASRLVASEVVVSNLIASLRAAGEIQEPSIVLQLFRRRNPSPITVLQDIAAAPQMRQQA